MTGKVIYTAPLKALSAEKFHEWTKGVFQQQRIVQLTGDTLTSAKVRADMMVACKTADIVLMTSELLDSLTRNFQSENYQWLLDVRLLICDESHIITSPGRGDCVEAAVMRFTQINSEAKIWMLSATLPNVDEFSQWLTTLNGKTTQSINSSWRPTQLVWHFLQHNTFGSYNEIMLDKVRRTIEIVKEKPDEKFLLFVWDKTTGRLLVSRLRECGVVCEFHNADVEFEERGEILRRFEDDTDPLRVIVATTTIAWGSVHEDMEVVTPYGPYRFGSVFVGMLVISYNEIAQCYEWDTVVSKELCTEAEEIYIELDDGTQLVTGLSHPIYLYQDGFLTTRRADQLVAGDVMVQHGYMVSSVTTFVRVSQVARRAATGQFYDITVAKNHNFLPNGLLVHNCNTSAQNVVMVGVNRGMDTVDELDVIQAAGRAGRFGKAPEGHAYLICDNVKQWQIKVAQPRPVTSTLLNENALSFHICAEIKNKVISDEQTLYQWYHRTLASIQQPLTKEMVMAVLAKLEAWECIKIDPRGFYQCMPLGMVAATLYYHPKDVHHWAKCFSHIDRHQLWGSDLALSYALANPSAQLPYIARSEQDRVSHVMAALQKVWKAPAKASTLFADIYDLLCGEKPSMYARAFRQDAERVCAALNWIGGIKTLTRSDMWLILSLRLKYGVAEKLVGLCRLPQVGAARAEKLWASGIKSIEDVLRNPAKVQQVVGSRHIEDVLLVAKKLSRQEQSGE